MRCFKIKVLEKDRKMKNKNILMNTIMLYGLTAAKLVFPLLTLPYLTRVLSIEKYGVVSYVKSFMSYMQLLVDFGFMLSGVKEVVRYRDDRQALSQVVVDIFAARVILGCVGGVAVLICTFFIPILRPYKLFTVLSYVPIAMSALLFDYYFRGIEKMQIITVRYVVMKGISTLLTLIFVKSDVDIELIPILDSLGSLIAVILVLIEINRAGVIWSFPSIKNALRQIRESAVYFISNMATSAFGALNTFLIGIYLPEADIALWSVSLQIILALQQFYVPISDGIYPEMLKNKKIILIRNVLLIFMPIISLGVLLSALLAPLILKIVAGSTYMQAVDVFRCLLPILLFSFPATLLGWPVLGAINKQRQVTASTTISALVQIFGLIILIFNNCFTLINIAIIRCMTELVMLIIRFSFFVCYRKDFNWSDL